MTTDRHALRPHGLLRPMVTMLCALWLAACSEGYPTEDAPQLHPASMNLEQLLVAMNALGQEPQLGRRWRYALHDDCELEVAVRDGGMQRRRVALEGAQITTRSVDALAEIRLMPKTDDVQAVTVLETRMWSDTLRARSLLTYLVARCAETEARDP